MGSGILALSVGMLSSGMMISMAVLKQRSARIIWCNSDLLDVLKFFGVLLDALSMLVCVHIRS